MNMTIFAEKGGEEMDFLLNWSDSVNYDRVDTINEDFILINDLLVSPRLFFPIKLDVTFSVICTKGRLKGAINLKEFDEQAPCILTVQSGKILQFESISNDFRGMALVMSQHFFDGFNIDTEHSFYMSMFIQNNPCTVLTVKEMDLMLSHFNIIQEAVRMIDNPFRLKIVKHLTLAFFYSTGHLMYKIPSDTKSSKREVMANKFLNLVELNYKKQRNVEFYSGKLSLTPKYLSKLIKEISGNSASDWIHKYVILEAQSLLRSTDMTVQQISDELNFTSQSFFGKYFKQHVGISPRDYRNS